MTKTKEHIETPFEFIAIILIKFTNRNNELYTSFYKFMQKYKIYSINKTQLIIIN